MTDTNASVVIPLRDHTTVENAPTGKLRYFFDLSKNFRSVDDAGNQIIYPSDMSTVLSQLALILAKLPTVRKTILATDSVSNGETLFCAGTTAQVIHPPLMTGDNIRFKIKSKTTYNVTITPLDAALVEDDTTAIINAAGTALEFCSEGGNWHIVG